MGVHFGFLLAKLGHLWEGVLLTSQLDSALAIFFGVTEGIIIGALPGLGPTMVIAITIPLTYSLSPLAAIMLLLGIYVGGIYGGSITAILINTPGTPAAAATVLDGYPMAKQGKSGKALHLALKSSVAGDVIATLILMVVAFPLASFALRFGAPERFSLLLFALTVIGGVSGPSLVKGLIVASLGLLIATVGMDPISGAMRFSFDSINLQGGIQLIPMLIGLFAVPEILTVAEKAVSSTKETVSAIPPPKVPSDRYCTWTEFFRYWKTILRSSFIGSFIGALPGIGSAVAAFLAYGSAKRKSKEADMFGKGAMEGVAAAESGNNAVCGAALIPLLTLGIPGDVVTAVLLGALMIHDLTPGPLLFQQKPDIVFALFVGLLLANVVLITVGSIIIRYSKFLTTAPAYLLFPIVIVFCVIGSYSIQNELFDVGIMLGFGVLGYIMRRFEFPAAPLLIAFLLGPMVENSLRQALIMSKSGWFIFVTRPISLIFLILTAISIFGIFMQRRRQKG